MLQQQLTLDLKELVGENGALVRLHLRANLFAEVLHERALLDSCGGIGGECMYDRW